MQSGSRFCSCVFTENVWYMKQPLIALLVIGLCWGQLACDNRKQGESASTVASDKMPKITFKEKGIHDFGNITEGDTIEHKFLFTNTGAYPLIINNITASCGCTTPEWPREPIEPGEESFVKVRFNSRNKEGEQSKTVTIFANTEPAMTDLQFRVYVDKPNAAGNDTTQSK